MAILYELLRNDHSIFYIERTKTSYIGRKIVDKKLINFAPNFPYENFLYHGFYYRETMLGAGRLSCSKMP